MKEDDYEQKEKVRDRGADPLHVADHPLSDDGGAAGVFPGG